MHNRFISDNDIKRVLEHAIEYWGKQAQLTQAMEELAELQVECSKLARGISKIDNLHKEIADVRIMLRQIEMIAGCEDYSGQLCIEIAERDSLEKLDNLLSMLDEPEIQASGYSDKAVIERNKKQDEVSDLIKKSHISTNKTNYVEVQMCKNCLHHSKEMSNTTAPTIVCHKGYSTNRFRCQEWEREEQPIGVTTTNAKIGIDYADPRKNDTTAYATGGFVTLTGKGFDVHEKEVLSTIADAVAENIEKAIRPNKSCDECIYRSNAKKDDSFIDNYWCAKNELWVQLQHYCTEFKQRD